MDDNSDLGRMSIEYCSTKMIVEKQLSESMKKECSQIILIAKQRKPALMGRGTTGKTDGSVKNAD